MGSQHEDMVRSEATTPAQYLAELPEDRRDLVETIRRTILDNLPDGYEETMTFGMLGYVVPLEVFPDTYNGEPVGSVALANQKRYVAVYLMGIYADEAERTLVRRRVEGDRQEARHGQVVRALQEARRRRPRRPR